VGFPLVVLYTFGDDDGHILAALIAYYGFLALFPSCSSSRPCSAAPARESARLELPRSSHTRTAALTGATGL
jgi:hypothetical protein